MSLCVYTKTKALNIWVYMVARLLKIVIIKQQQFTRAQLQREREREWDDQEHIQRHNNAYKKHILWQPTGDIKRKIYTHSKWERAERKTNLWSLLCFFVVFVVVAYSFPLLSPSSAVLDIVATNIFGIYVLMWAQAVLFVWVSFLSAAYSD